MAERRTSMVELPQVLVVSLFGANVIQNQPNPEWAREAVNTLSRREREILPLLAARWTNQEIADALFISYRTVTTHVTHIYDKLGIGSRREALPFVLVATDDDEELVEVRAS